MNVIEVDIVCPACGERHDASTQIGSDTSSGPKDGDFSACSSCGTMSVFDSTLDGGLRPPTMEDIGSIGISEIDRIEKRIREAIAERRIVQ